MKRVTAAEAKADWFHLLNAVEEGEEVVIERGGTRLLLRRQEEEDENWPSPAASPRIPSYEGVIRAEDVDQADKWRWEWRGPGDLLHPVLEPDA